VLTPRPSDAAHCARLVTRSLVRIGRRPGCSGRRPIFVFSAHAAEAVEAPRQGCEGRVRALGQCAPVGMVVGWTGLPRHGCAGLGERHRRGARHGRGEGWTGPSARSSPRRDPRAAPPPHSSGEEATGAARDRGESGGSWDITKLAGPNRAVHLDRVHQAPRRGRDRPIGRRAAASGGWTAQVPSLMPSRWSSVTPSAAREARASCVRIRASRCAGQRCRSRCRARRASPSRRQPAGRRRGRRPSGRRTGTPRRPGEPSCPARFRGPQRW
jgi:hypothetical protein